MNITLCSIPLNIPSFIIDPDLSPKIIFVKNEGIFIVESNVWFKLNSSQKVKIYDDHIDLWPYFEIYKKHIIENITISILPNVQSSVQCVPIDKDQSICLLSLSFDTLKSLDIFEFTLLHEIGHLKCPKFKASIFDFLINFIILSCICLSVFGFLGSVFLILISTFFVIDQLISLVSINYISIIKIYLFSFLLLGLSFLILSADYHWINFVKIMKNYRKEMFCDTFAMTINPEINLKNVEKNFVSEGFSFSHPSSELRFQALYENNQKSIYYYLFFSLLSWIKRTKKS